MSTQIKCHKCGKQHKAHTATTLSYLNGKYYWGVVPNAIQVSLGGTCAEKLWKNKEILKFED